MLPRGCIHPSFPLAGSEGSWVGIGDGEAPLGKILHSPAVLASSWTTGGSGHLPYACLLCTTQQVPGMVVFEWVFVELGRAGGVHSQQGGN